LRRLQKERKGFVALAQSRSQAPEASQGGLMGRFARGQLPHELDEPAFALPAGSTSEIIATPLGYHVLRVDEHQPSRQRSMDECRDEIRAQLGREKTDRATREFVRTLLARAKVNHEALEDPRS
jgi:parvulin-like peptidyl-prolyl isomerase